MSGKGSGRRPQQIPEDEAAANWARIFGKQDTNDQPNGPEPDDKESQDGGC
jgi:hypothetical protein